MQFIVMTGKDNQRPIWRRKTKFVHSYIQIILGQCLESFIQQGYDDFKQIISFSNTFEEMDNTIKD